MRSRRDLIIALGVTTLFPNTLFAQAKQPVLIGWLSLNSREEAARTKGLRVRSMRLVESIARNNSPLCLLAHGVRSERAAIVQHVHRPQ